MNKRKKHGCSIPRHRQIERQLIRQISARVGLCRDVAKMAAASVSDPELREVAEDKIYRHLIEKHSIHNTATKYGVRA